MARSHPQCQGYTLKVLHQSLLLQGQKRIWTRRPKGGFSFRICLLVFEEEVFSIETLETFGSLGVDVEARVRALTGAGLIFSLLGREASDSGSLGGSSFKSPRAGGGEARGCFLSIVGVTCSVDFRARDLNLFPEEGGAIDVEARTSFGSIECPSEPAGEWWLLLDEEEGITFLEGPLGFLMRAMEKVVG